MSKNIDYLPVDLDLLNFRVFLFRTPTIEFRTFREWVFIGQISVHPSDLFEPKLEIKLLET